MSTDSPDPRSRLFCRGGRLKGTSFEVGRAASIGRAEASDCRIDDPSVAEEHARIRWDEDRGRYELEDLGSPQGTEVDGTVVRGSMPLERLHVITFGGTSFVFQRMEGVSISAPPSPQTQHLDSVPTIPVGLMGGRRDPAEIRWLLEVEIEGEQHRFELSDGENRIGRVAADIVLPSREISRSHAVIVVDGREVRVRDLGSTNFTFLDGERLLTEVRVPLGATLSFGPHPARIVAEDR